MTHHSPKRRSIALAAAFALSIGAFALTQQEEAWKAPLRASKKKNPIPADEKSLAAGKVAYEQHCLSCHGTDGKGDGPAAKDLPKKVRDLADPQTLAENDGALFWKITEGRAPMPAYEKLLTEQDRWHVVNYLRALTSRTKDPAERGGSDAPRNALSRVLTPYLVLQDALAKDDVAAAQGAVDPLLKAVHGLSETDVKGLGESERKAWTKVHDDISLASSRLKEAGTLAALRAAFKPLSEATADAVSRFGHAEAADLTYVTCPMAFQGSAGAWIQRKGKVRNPYLGSQMLECGEVVRPLPPAPKARKEGGQ